MFYVFPSGEKPAHRASAGEAALREHVGRLGHRAAGVYHVRSFSMHSAVGLGKKGTSAAFDHHSSFKTSALPFVPVVEEFM